MSTENSQRNDELLVEVKRQLSMCAGFEGDENSQNRQDALKYYFQRERGDEEAGRSNVVSGDLSAMVEANLAQMLDSFTSKALVEFDADSAEDEDQAQLEADVCTRLVMGENNGFVQLAAAIKDALLMRNGVIEVDVEERREVDIEKLAGATDVNVALVESDDKVKAKAIRREGDNVWFKTVRERRAFKAEAFPLEEFFYTKNWHSLDLQDIPMCGRRRIVPRSELIAAGCAKSKVDDLKKADPSSIVANERNPFQMPGAEAAGLDKSRDLVEWYRCFFLADLDGDGISERIEFWFSGETVLRVQEVSLVPYAAGTAILNPHRFTGVSLYDKLFRIQDLTTGLERALMDNANAVNKHRTAGLTGKVNNDDINDPRVDGHIRIKATVQDVRTAIMGFQVPDNSQGLLLNIDHQRSRRTEMGGAALELSTGQMQLNDRVGSEGLDRAYSVMEQLAALMTKLCAQTLLRSLFLLTHRTLREYYDEELTVKRNGVYLKSNPAEWKARTSCTVKPGMSPGERARRAATLESMLGKQIELAGVGLDDVLVNVEGFYQALMDWARTLDVPNPEQYWIDPRSEGAKKAKAKKEEQQARTAAMQQRLIDMALELEQTQTLLGKYKADQETQFKYFNAVLGAEIEEAKITGKGIVDILAARLAAIQAESQEGAEDGDGVTSAAA